MVEGFFGINDNIIEVKEGDELDLGKHRLQFYMAPMVHWPETMVTYEASRKILFSADAFGSFGTLDGGIFDDEMDFSYFADEMRRYYSNIVGKYGSPVQKALEKLKGLSVSTIASAHGPVIRSHINEVIDLYDRWSRFDTDEGVVIAFASMYGNTEEMVEVTARALAEEGIKEIRIYDVSKTHSSFIISDIFKYKGVVLASPTYNSKLHPNMEALVNKLLHMGVKNHYLGILGSFTWAGTATKQLKEFGESLNWEIVGQPVEEKHALKKQKYDECRILGKNLAEKLISERK
jgi:flavorubredoxin